MTKSKFDRLLQGKSATINQAELVALIEKISLQISQSPDKAAIILTSWINAINKPVKSSSITYRKKNAA